MPTWSWMAGLLSALGLSSPASETPTELTAEQMEQTRGGMQVRQYQPFQIKHQRDNIPFDYDVLSYFEHPEVVMELYSGNTKYWGTFADVNTGSWTQVDFRTKGPLDTSFRNLDTRYCWMDANGALQECGVEPGGAQQTPVYIEDVRVTKVWLHNMRTRNSDGSYTIRTSMPTSAMSEVTDYLRRWVPSKNLSADDLVNLNCGSVDPNVSPTWNFRYDRYSIVTVPTNCWRPRYGGPQSERCTDFDSEMNRIVADIDPNQDYLHVFVYDSFEVWKSGDGRYADAGGYSGDRNWLAVKSDQRSIALNLTLVHELGHKFGLSHASSSSCDGNTSQNLMCAFFGGTTITSSQCRSFRKNPSWLRDWLHE